MRRHLAQCRAEVTRYPKGILTPVLGPILVPDMALETQR